MALFQKRGKREKLGSDSIFDKPLQHRSEVPVALLDVDCTSGRWDDMMIPSG